MTLSTEDIFSTPIFLPYEEVESVCKLSYYEAIQYASKGYSVKREDWGKAGEHRIITSIDINSNDWIATKISENN